MAWRPLLTLSRMPRRRLGAYIDLPLVDPHPAVRCTIRLAVSYAAVGVSPTQNGRSRVVLSRVGDGGVLAMAGCWRFKGLRGAVSETRDCRAQKVQPELAEVLVWNHLARFTNLVCFFAV